MVRKMNKGFTMIELLVVLVIIAILAAVAAPLYLANTKRAKASEAVSAMALMRQAERDYKVNHNLYFDVAADDVQDPLPPTNAITPANGAVTAGFGLDVDSGIPQYFSNKAFTIQAKGTDLNAILNDPTGAANVFQNPPPVDFLIKVDGKDSVLCKGGGTPVTSNCATRATEVGGESGSNTDDYILYMDNSGRIAISYDSGTKWSTY